MKKSITNINHCKSDRYFNHVCNSFINSIFHFRSRHHFTNMKVNDYQYFIQSAVQKDLPWNTLIMFLTDLAPTLDKSRQIIKTLVQELEKWVDKVENEAKNGAKPYFDQVQMKILMT